MIFFSAILLLLLLLAGEGGAVNITVFMSPTGNDSHAGTSEATALRSAAAMLMFVQNRVPVMSAPAAVALRVHFGNGTYAQGDCSWPFLSPGSGSSLWVLGDGGTTFNCSGNNASTVEVFKVAGWARATVRGLRFTGMRVECVGLPCSVFNVSGANVAVALDGLTFDDNRLTCRNWTERAFFAPLAVLAGSANVTNSSFLRNAVTIGAPSALPPSEDRQVLAASAATFHLVDAQVSLSST